VSVDFATADGTASAGSDYESASGQVEFQPGETDKPVTVQVNGDVLFEEDETFFVNLSNESNATVGDGQGLGTITDDDGGGQTITSFQDGVDGYSGTLDTYLLSSLPTRNGGVWKTLKVDGEPDRSILLSWDLTSIPSGSTIESVTVAFNVTNSSGDSYEFYELKQAWVEREATWNEYASGQNWEVSGADGSGDRGSIELGSITAPTTGIQTISLNAAGVAVVQSWVDNPSLNHGFIVLDYIMGTDGLTLRSRNSPTVSERPKLTVTYTSGG